MNKVTLIGNIGKDIEIIKSKQGLSLVAFSVATTKKNKDGEEVTQWHNCSAFDKTADNIARELKKGSRVMIEGTIVYQQYEKDGIKRTSTKIVVHHIAKMLQNGHAGESDPISVETPSFSAKTYSRPFECDLDEGIPF